MPNAFRASGVGWAGIQLFLGAYISYLSIICLVYCGAKTKLYSFGELAEYSHGKKFRVFVDIVFFLNNFGTLVSYTILLQENLALTCSFIKELWWPNMPSLLWQTDSPLWVIIPSIIVFPMCIKKKLGDVRFLAIFAFFVIIYLTGVIVGYSLDPSNNPVDVNLTKISFFKFKGICTTFSLFIFGYTCQQNVLDAYNELQFQNVRRMKKVVTRQFLIVTTLYILIGFFGYLNWPVLTSDMTGNLLTFYAPTTHVPALVAVILLSVAISVPMPLLFKPVKDCIHLLIYPSNLEENWIHYPLCVAIQVMNIVICCLAVINNVGMDKVLTYVSGSTSP